MALRDVLAFYGTCPAGSRADPVIFLRGDAVELRDTGLAANPFYLATSPYDVQALAEQFAATFGRPYLHLARPGILGSSGNHLDRRRPRRSGAGRRSAQPPETAFRLGEAQPRGPVGRRPSRGGADGAQDATSTAR